MTEQEQIDLRQAVDIATKTIRELYPEAALEDLLLEEVFHFETNQEWEVTLGFSLPYSSAGSGAISTVFQQTRPRAYKRFKIDANTGEVRGMLEGRIEVE